MSKIITFNLINKSSSKQQLDPSLDKKSKPIIRDQQHDSETTIALRQVEIRHVLKHRLTVVYVLYGIWGIKNSDFWMF